MYASHLPAALCKFPEKAVNNLQCSSKVETFVTALQQMVEMLRLVSWPSRQFTQQLHLKGLQNRVITASPKHKSETK